MIPFQTSLVSGEQKDGESTNRRILRDPSLPSLGKPICRIPADVLNCKVPFPLKILELFIYCSTLLCHQPSSSGELQPSAHFGTIHYRCSRQPRCGWLLSLGVSISRFIMRKKCTFTETRQGSPQMIGAVLGTICRVFFQPHSEQPPTPLAF